MVEWLTDYEMKGMLSKTAAEHIARTDAQEMMSKNERDFGRANERGVLDTPLYTEDAKYRGIMYRLRIIRRYRWVYDPFTNTISLNSYSDDRWVFLEPTEKTKELHEMTGHLSFVETPFLWEDSGHSYTREMPLREKWEWVDQEAHRQIDAFWSYFTVIESFLKRAKELLREAMEHILHCPRCMTGELEAKPLWIWVCSNSECSFESKMTIQ